MLRKLLLAAASSLTLAACAVGPDYAAPQTPGAAAAPFISANDTDLVSLAPVQGDWWRLYDDPVLDRLIEDALAANTDIRVAVARIDRARALLRETRSDRLPSVDVNGQGSYSRLPADQVFGGDRENGRYDVGLDVAYEVDLFGRVGRNVEASRGDLAATEADAEAVRVAVVAETTRAYADAASSAERVQVAERIVDLLDRSIRLTARRQEVGLATRLDTARIQTLRNQRQADIPSLRAERQAALFRLATLTGRTPQELPVEASARTTRLDLARPIPVGDGAALLARRPDVRAAERRLAAATARIGVATADLYPRISLGGSVGSAGSDIGDIFSGGPFNWLVGGLLGWAINQEPARARIEASEADSRAALATFDGTVLQAIEETETALARYKGVIDRRDALKAARDDAEVAVRIIRAQQREGQISSLELIDAERTFAESEAGLAEADARIASSQIDLFRALAGRW